MFRTKVLLAVLVRLCCTWFGFCRICGFGWWLAYAFMGMCFRSYAYCLADDACCRWVIEYAAWEVMGLLCCALWSGLDWGSICKVDSGVDRWVCLTCRRVFGVVLMFIVVGGLRVLGGVHVSVVCKCGC